MRDRDRNPAEDIGIAVILVTGAQHRIVERIGPLGLGRGRRSIERRRTQARAELPAYGQQPFERGAKRFVSILRARRMESSARDDDHDAGGQKPWSRACHFPSLTGSEACTVSVSPCTLAATCSAQLPAMPGSTSMV